ncbi:MAG: thioredoxin family protein [Thaumarchaeota archaeon]|nr:thioredoxin family protein [Nitrososphaerota archaeon]
MTSLIGKEDTKEIRTLFRSQLESEVDILLFTSKEASVFCAPTKRLLEEVASLTDKVRLQVLDNDEGTAKAVEMAVDLAPTTVVISSNGAKLYFVGIPAGRQLKCLVEDIVDSSRGRTQMDEQTRRIIRRVTVPTIIRVFVTTFCPYSPLVVRSAHRFALENPMIRALMVETAEFPELTKRYNVVGVPRTVINDRLQFDGAPSEEAFATKVLEASM